MKRLAPGLCRVCALADFERALLLFSFQLCKIDGDWKLMNWSVSSRLEDIEKAAPIELVVPGRPLPKVPGLNYQAFVKGHLKPIEEGNIDRALDHVEHHAGSPEQVAAAREEWRQRLSLLYGSSGKAAGYEVAGVQRLGQLTCKVYAIAYFEGRAILFTYQFTRRNNSWKLAGFGIRDHFRDLEDLVAPQAVGAGSSE